MNRPRCPWPGTDPLYIDYHDREWGVAVHDDRKIFEFLVLEGAQAGLSWLTVLRKRDHYRQVMDGFDPEIVAGYDEEKIQGLLADPGLIRNQAKIRSAVNNARLFLKVREEFGSFDTYIWSFVNGTPVRNAWVSISDIPAETRESQALSKDLKARGFKFVGPTICYAYMQATGMVNDHLVSCFRYDQV